MRGVRIAFFWVRIGALSWVLLVTVISGLQQLGYLDQSPRLDAIGWGVSLGIIGAESLASLIRERIERGSANLRAELDRWSLGLVLEQIEQTSGGKRLKFHDIGVSVWVPTYLSRFRGRFLGLPRDQFAFKRLNRFRPNNFPQSSGVNWTGQVGTIGDCWRSEDIRYFDNHAIATRFRGQEITAEQWASKVDGDVKRGFTRAQFMRIVGKYSEIRAIPIRHSDPERDTMIGVLTIDRIYRAGEDPFVRHLHTEGTARRGVAAASLASASIAGKHRVP